MVDREIETTTDRSRTSDTNPKSASQGHPELPRLWDKYITKILIDKMGFTPTTHEPCLYFKYDNTGLTTSLLQTTQKRHAMKLKTKSNNI